MEIVNLSLSDRARIDALTDALDRYVNGKYDNVLVSCREAARLMGKSPATVSLMLKDGRLKRTTIGDSTGILISEVIEQSSVMRQNRGNL